jgi:AcrR family transcriptional regulator
MTEVQQTSPSRGRGRPRQFDRDLALGHAMRVFWDRGYEGATFDELIAAMAISPSSFYNAFGSKEALYREAVETYLTGPGGFFVSALGGEGTALDAFRRLMLSTAKAYTDPTDPSGCMVSLSAVHNVPEHAEVREFMRTVRARAKKLMKDRLVKGVSDGELASDTDVAQLAEFFETVFRGMAVRARDGADRRTLEKTGAIALDAWPASPKGNHDLDGRSEN